MADDLSDLAASLTADVAAATERSKKADSELRGAPLEEVKPADEPADEETKEPTEEAPQLEVQDIDEIDESYHDSVEFPDLSQIPHPDDVEDGESTDLEAEEGEEDQDSEETSEDEAPEPQEAVSFDLEATLKEIDDLKTPELRKQYLRTRAEKNKLEQDLEAAKTEALEAKEKAETIEKKHPEESTAPPVRDIKDHEPYKQVAKEYGEWRERAIRSIKNAKIRQLLGQDEAQLRAEGSRIEGISDPDAYDKARENLENTIKSRYGDFAPQVLTMVNEATDYEVKAARIQQEFESASQQDLQQWATDAYSKESKEVYDRVVGNYAVTPEQVKENPFAMQAFVHRVLNDPKQGERAHQIFRDDVELVQKTLAGPPPLVIEETWTNTEKQEARQLHADEIAKFARYRKEHAPVLMQDGLWARRVVPMLMKELSELRDLKKKVKPTPTPRRPGKKSAPKKTGDAREQARKDLDDALNAIK